MSRQPASHYSHEEIVSFQKLRTFIGFTGILLPVMAVLGCWITGAGKGSYQISISHFYYSKMHIIFVGVLCVLGGFLITYRGKNAGESILSNWAGIFAFGIASCPTTLGGFRFIGGKNQYLDLTKEVSYGWGAVHFGFAFALFFCFVLFCLKYFQKPDESYSGEELKKFNRRKLIYKLCGWAIIISIALIALFNFVIKPNRGIFYFSTFIFETTSLWAFGTAWLVKGSAMWKSIPVANKLVRAIR